MVKKLLLTILGGFLILPCAFAKKLDWQFATSKHYINVTCWREDYALYSEDCIYQVWNLPRRSNTPDMIFNKGQWNVATDGNLHWSFKKGDTMIEMYVDNRSNGDGILWVYINDVLKSSRKLKLLGEPARW